MSLQTLLASFESREGSITMYAAKTEPAVNDWLDETHADVLHRRLPRRAPSFLVVRRNDEFVASVPIEAVEAFLEPTIGGLSGTRIDEKEKQTILHAFEGIVSSSLDRRRLLAVARDIERHAYAIGTGQLHVGFQSLSAMADQVPVYERLGRETQLDVHVYGADDWDPPTIPGVTVHAESADVIGEYWFLAFDGGGDESAGSARTHRVGSDESETDHVDSNRLETDHVDSNRLETDHVDSDEPLALLAEEVAPGEYRGVWTSERHHVTALLDHLRETYG